MTDIVERLRDLYYVIDDPDKCCLDAIDEIERLRDQEKHCINEIGRLQLELQATKFCVNVHISERNIARLHAQRLEETNAKLRDGI